MFNFPGWNSLNLNKCDWGKDQLKPFIAGRRSGKTNKVFEKMIKNLKKKGIISK